MSATLREQLGAVFGGTWASCARKIEYRSREHAEHVAGLRMRDYPERIYVYRCTHCDGWHLTRMDPHT